MIKENRRSQHHRRMFFVDFKINKGEKNRNTHHSIECIIEIQSTRYQNPKAYKILLCATVIAIGQQRIEYTRSVCDIFDTCFFCFTRRRSYRIFS